MPKYARKAASGRFAVLPVSNDFYLHISNKEWVDNLLKKSISVQGGFAPNKQKSNIYILELKYLQTVKV